MDAPCPDGMNAYGAASTVVPPYSIWIPTGDPQVLAM